MTALEDVLDDLLFRSTDMRDQGDKFERLMLQFFRTDLSFRDRFADVWMWQDWPGRGNQPDRGIDLVATERETGEAVAIQCKFYDPQTTIYKQHIDSFLSESGKHPFKQRIVVTTTDHWGANAEAAIENQQIPVQRLRFKELSEYSIDWSQFDLSTPEVMELKTRKQLRRHQVEAVDKVIEGLATHDRGKLVMACGTGKTFTSLRLAERMVGAGGRVLFLVPSISLLSQSLREWSVESELTLRPFAVCSDVKVGKRSKAQEDEDIAVVDLALPATTDPDRLLTRLSANGDPEAMTVVFSTYQSIDVVAKAQDLGAPEFDLIICDEAHRTTGVTLANADESAFSRVHDGTRIRGHKRLYMTATSRIYDDASKAKAGEAQAVVTSMDDETTYGPELHRLGFGEAVAKGLLTDYKVLVLAVDEKDVSRTFQEHLKDADASLKLDDVAKIVGCWNGLAKRGHSDSGFGDDTSPMTRAVAFAGSIATSKQFAAEFARIAGDYVEARRVAGVEEDEHPLRVEADHVDGTYNVLERNNRLDWLKGDSGDSTCRVLSNARCLSEGVDVPALDAVMFLNPRKSVVDVVQSVGRVMRLAPGKQYGYIILPIGIPAGMAPEDALRDNTKFQVVWEVLQALRAHDERFDAMVNKLDLNRGRDDRVQVIFSDKVSDREDGESAGSGQGGFVQPSLNLEWLDQWRDAIYAKIVQKVGSRRYWEQWAKDVAGIADAHRTRITALLDDPDLPVHAEFDAFLTGLRGNLNESISRGDAIDMLAQHLITRPVFDALFEDYSFTEHNPVSQVMERMLATLDEHNLQTENQTLDRFYESVRLRAAGIDNAEGKQRIIAELYEKFFKTAFPKSAESLGIVYTPVEIVDFIIRSVEHLLNTEFGASLSDKGVHVLDPFTGTGTFIVRLLQSGLIRRDDLLRKYTEELHANEILLLAYYIAAINIEATMHGLLTKHDPDAGYVPFDGIVLTDTFQMTEEGDVLDAAVFPANNERAIRQLELDIRVIIGNPPYSVGQGTANDNNANVKYPTLDRAIEQTYAARSAATNKNSLYDSYIRAIRWASDRVKDAGIIGFVTNGGFLDANTADGLRKSLAGEFAAIYVYNLRGNQRTAGETSRREGGKVFGGGSRNTVAITFLVKQRTEEGAARLLYRDIGDYLTREQKLDIVARGDLALIEWQSILPNASGDWVNQRGEHFDKFPPLSARNSTEGFLLQNSPGLQTNRDAWVYNSSRESLESNVQSTIAFFNAQSEMRAKSPEAQLSEDSTKISWSSSLRPRAERGETLQYDREKIVIAHYRPFQRQRVYFDANLNHRRGQLHRFFPTPAHRNLGIAVAAPGSSASAFSALATDCLPDLVLPGAGNPIQYFPRWTWEPLSTAKSQATFDLETLAGARDVPVVAGYRRVDNVNPAMVAEYRAALGSDVTADGLFYYIYGILHSPNYRSAFLPDLKRSLPRIPRVATRTEFDAIASAGQRLMDLHIGFESVQPFPLTVSGDHPAGIGAADIYGWFAVSKMRWAGSGRIKDKSTIIYNSRITVAGIPDEAHEYMVGSRSGLEWVMERYQVKTDKASGIVNDPNDWSREVGDPRYILDLLGRVVTVSVETMRIVKSLPFIDFEALS